MRDKRFVKARPKGRSLGLATCNEEMIWLRDLKLRETS